MSSDEVNHKTAIVLPHIDLVNSFLSITLQH